MMLRPPRSAIFEKMAEEAAKSKERDRLAILDKERRELAKQFYVMLMSDADSKNFTEEQILKGSYGLADKFMVYKPKPAPWHKDY